MNKYNQYIYKDGQWRLIGTSATSDSDNAKVKSYVETVEEENTFYASISDIDRINALLDDDAALLRDANPTPEDPSHSLLNYQGTFKQWLKMWDVEVLDDYFNYLDDMGYNWGSPLYSTPNENITHTIGEGAEAVTYNLNWLSTVSNDHTMTGFIGTTPFTLNIVTDSETGSRTIAVTMGDENELKNPSVFLYKNGEIFNLALKDSNDFANVYFKNSTDTNIEKNSINLYDKYIDDERGRFILEHPDLMLESDFPINPEEEHPSNWENYVTEEEENAENFPYPGRDDNVLQTWFSQLSIKQWKDIVNIFLEQFPDGIETNSNINFLIDGVNYNFNYIWDANINPDNLNQFRIQIILPINSEQGWRFYTLQCEDGKTWDISSTSHAETRNTYSDRINYLTTNTDISTFSNSVTKWKEIIKVYFLITDWIGFTNSSNINWEEVYNNGVPKNNPSVDYWWNGMNMNWLYDLEYFSQYSIWMPYGLFIIDNKLYYFDKMTASDGGAAIARISPYPNDILKNVVVFSDKNNNTKMYSFGDSEEDIYVKKTGDTMTGTLFIDAETPYSLETDTGKIGFKIGNQDTRIEGVGAVAFAVPDIERGTPDGSWEQWGDIMALGNGSFAHGRGIVAMGEGATAEGYQETYNSGQSQGFEISLSGPANSLTYTFTTTSIYVSNQTPGFLIDPNSKEIVAMAEAVTSTDTSSQYTIKLDKTLDENNAVDNVTYWLRIINAYGRFSHSEGIQTQTIGDSSHAEGEKTKALGTSSHAEGSSTQAFGVSSHAEGYQTKALGSYSHTEGRNTLSNEPYSHAEGQYTIAKGQASHAEGNNNTNDFQQKYIYLTGAKNATTYTYSVNSGDTLENLNNFLQIGYVICGKSSYTTNGWATITAINTTNSTLTVDQTLSSKKAMSRVFLSVDNKQGNTYGQYSHTEGNNTQAWSRSQHAAGEYNIADMAGTNDTRGTYASIIGNGTADNARSNAATVAWNGEAWFQGDIYTGSTSGTNKDAGSKKLATEDYVTTSVASAIGDITSIDYQVVASLPATGTKGIIYLVSNSEGSPNLYDEYIWINNQFEKLGYAVPVINTITPAAIDAIFAD